MIVLVQTKMITNVFPLIGEFINNIGFSWKVPIHGTNFHNVRIVGFWYKIGQIVLNNTSRERIDDRSEEKSE